MSEGSLELEFISEVVDEKIGDCQCGSSGCESVIFRKRGSKAEYRVEYDPKGFHETNVYIRMDVNPLEEMSGITPVVFNGKCETNMDFAKVLKMVII